MHPQHADRHPADNPPSLNGLGLLDEPFADIGAGHFFYADADGQQRLDLLLHLAPYSPLLVIVGKPGAGKTTLLKQFMARVEDSWRVVAVTARADMGRDELLREVAKGFGLLLDHRVDYEELYAALVAHLRALRQNANAPILLLDDAQYLSAAMMEAIHRLCAENDDGHILSVLLFGTPQLQNLLDSPALAARVTHTFEVTPLGEEQTGAYIRHRLRAAGAADDGPFDGALIGKIYAASGGVPGRINELAQQALMDKTRDGKARKAGRGGTAEGRPSKRLLLVALAGAVVVLILAGPLRTLVFPMPHVLQSDQPLELPPPLIVGEDNRVERPAIPAPAPQGAAPPAETAQPLSLPPPAQVAEPPAVEVPPLPAAKAPEAPPAPAKPAVPVRSTEPAVAMAPSTPTPAPPPQTHDFKGAEWVREQSPDHYTLQLMALREQKTARQFIAMHELQGQAAYFPIRRDGRTLYVVVYGDYPDYAAATRAAKKLPANWGTPNPWVRGFKNLQEALGK